eukprot:366278-Chlamydomonas_euryale.AAC.64
MLCYRTGPGTIIGTSDPCSGANCVVQAHKRYCAGMGARQPFVPCAPKRHPHHENGQLLALARVPGPT